LASRAARIAGRQDLGLGEERLGESPGAKA
jgi:hypothetical protein